MNFTITRNMMRLGLREFGEGAVNGEITITVRVDSDKSTATQLRELADQFEKLEALHQKQLQLAKLEKQAEQVRTQIAHLSKEING